MVSGGHCNIRLLKTSPILRSSFDGHTGAKCKTFHKKITYDFFIYKDENVRESTPSAYVHGYEHLIIISLTEISYT
jgi:hypothetical protein